MGLFSKPEVVVLKESSDARDYLSKLEDLQKKVAPKSKLAKLIEKEVALTKAGIVGEDAIMYELKNSGMDLVVLHDIYIETSDGRGAQIDYYVVTPYVSVFIECKNLYGDIEINSKGDFIRTFYYGNKRVKEGIYSPITQNERHLSINKEIITQNKGILGLALLNHGYEEFTKSLVVLANPKTVVNDRYAPKSVKAKVIRGDQLVATLKNMKSSSKSNKKEMLQMGESMLSRNIDSRKDYMQKYIDMQQAAEEDMGNCSGTVPSDSSDDSIIRDENITSYANPSTNGTVPSDSGEAVIIRDENTVSNMSLSTKEEATLVCPRCGRELVLRIAKKGDNAGNQFYGCSGFPKCRYIRQL